MPISLSGSEIGKGCDTLDQHEIVANAKGCRLCWHARSGVPEFVAIRR
jgi:hypothetical protein